VQGLPAGEGRIECSHIFYDEDPGTSSFAAMCRSSLKNGSGPLWLIEVDPFIVAFCPLCTVLPV
jgi:hypothetical protein